MNKINYHKKCKEIIEQNKREDTLPSLLLHSCCAPCSSYCIEWLSNFFSITVYYYNPNITQSEEYEKRKEEQIRLINEMKTLHPVSFAEGTYAPQDFFETAKGYEHSKEGGERCFRCYHLRMLETARYAKENDFDYFCTTLSISPLKNAQKINEIGQTIGSKTCVRFLPSDFKKNEGYKRSIQLSEEYRLYRQDFCGCSYSKLTHNQEKNYE